MQGIFSLCFWIFFVIFYYSFAEDSNQVGANISNDIKNFYMKDRNTMNDKLFVPGNDGSKLLNTLGGESGSANFNCTSEYPFLEISYYPSTSLGDINLTIREDLDLNGIYEYVISLNGISAVCTTGFLVCSPGSTSNCKYYRIIVDDAGKVSFLNPVVYFPSLASCYFINSSAGKISLNYPEGVSKILTDISGLISNLVSGKKDFVGVVSYKDYQNFTVKLSGTKPSSCISANSDTLRRAKSYYSSGGKDDSSLRADIEAVKTGLSPDIPIDGMESSTAIGVYEYVSTSPSLKTQPPPDIYQCVIKNNIYVVETRYFTDGGCDLGTSNPCPTGLQEIGNNNFKCRVRGYNNGCGQNYNVFLCGKWETSWYIPDDEREYIVINGTVIRNVSRKGKNTEWGRGTCSGDTTKGTASCNSRGYTPSNDFVQARFSYYNLGACNGVPSTTLYYYLKLKDILSVQTYNNCPTDPSCKLKKEYVCDVNGQDCIQTYSSTGISVKLTPVCYSFKTDLENYVACSDGENITIQYRDEKYTLISGKDKWFYIKRVYVCDKGLQDPNMPGKDFFDDAVKTRESIYTNENKTEINYDFSSGRYTYKDFVSGNGSIRIGTLNSLNNSCNKVCRVKVKASLIDDYSAGSGEVVPNVDSSNSSPINAKDTLDYVELRECVNNVCPYNSSVEVLLSNCFCLGEDQNIDTETLSGIMGVYNASKDMICSSTPP